MRPHIPVLRVHVPDRSVIKHHMLSCANYVMKHRQWKIRLHRRCLSNVDLDPTAAGGSLRLDMRLAAPPKNEQTPFGPCMLHDESHQLLNQPGEDNLAGECL